MDKSEAGKYFGRCKTKYLSYFDEKTPKNNHIKGFICRKPNRYLGSLLITSVNNRDVCQFVQSMPKINYFRSESDISKSYEPGKKAYEKLDGTCLIIYPLFDENKNIIEIIPKTRGRAVADNHFIELYNKIDPSKIKKYYHDGNTGVLFFELFGILNQHEIIHYDVGVDIRLIGVYGTRFYKPQSLERLCSIYEFKQPDCLFELEGNYVKIVSKKYKHYFNHIKKEDLAFIYNQDAIKKIVELLDMLNKKYKKVNGRICTEGVVLNCTDFKDKQKYIKIKPTDIENKHRIEKGIPSTSIRKEVLKYFDEYGSEVKEIYETDEKHHTEYLHRMLNEEYSEELIFKSLKKIEKIFMQVWDSKQVPVSVHNLCEELINKYGDKGITECMRMFAQKYPMKKKDSRTVYQVLEKKFVNYKPCEGVSA